MLYNSEIEKDFDLFNGIHYNIIGLVVPFLNTTRLS